MLCGTDIINREKSVDHFRQIGVTPQLSTIYLLLRSRNFIFGGSVVTSTIPAGLLELKARFETWRTNRKYGELSVNWVDVMCAASTQFIESSRSKRFER